MWRGSAPSSVGQPASSARGWFMDALCIAVGVCLIAIICIRLSKGRIFWEDEVLGWTLIHDPSWRHMLREWSLGADSGGGLFYLSARGWFSLFGSSAISFRLYSAAGFAAAFASLWIALRPYYSWQTRMASIGAVWFIGANLVTHICEGRFYGLFLFGAMLSFYVTLRNAAGAERRNVLWFLLGFFANAVLVTSHFLGIVYSVAFLSGLIVVDRLRKHVRLLLYLPPVLAWCLLLPEKTAIRSAMNVALPHSWIARPSLHNLLGAYHAFDAPTDRLLLLLLIAVFALGWSNWRVLQRDMRTRFLQHPEIYLVTSMIALIPLAFFIESRVATPIFLDRYLMPVMIVPIVFAAEALRLIRLALSLKSSKGMRLLSMPAMRAVASIVFVAILIVWIFVNGPRHIPQRSDYTQALVESLPKGSIVVLPDSLVYTEVIARQYDSPVRFVYLLDWKRSIAPTAPRADVSSFHIMSSWRHAGYYPNSIEDSAPFLQAHPRFFVVETRLPYEDPDPNATDTVLASIARLPSEAVQAYPSIALTGLEDKVWLVCRSTCSPAP